MEKPKNVSYFVLLALFASLLQSCMSTNEYRSGDLFEVQQPDMERSPHTGMSRKHWYDAAYYLLDGAFSHVHTLDDPMVFPKQHDKTYPRNEEQLPTEKLEGLCRTLFVAAPLLKENPDLKLNGLKVADYYRHQMLCLIDPDSPAFIKHRARNGGPSQILVELGALAISLSVIPEVIWEPFTQEQKDALAATMLSYGDGPTVDSNWKFFNIFVLSFFKDRGYEVNEELLVKYLQESLNFYRGEGWYNDAPAYDYYSMWAFQTYGPLWAHLYGNRYYPEYAERFMNNLREMSANYPYMFNRDGKMNMWGRSISYRFGSVAPLAMLGYFNDPDINYGWMRRIASSTLLQFLQHPDFLEDRVPTLGFYGPFEPAVQIYSCRGSVYWCGKVFLSLFLPDDNPFWTAIENNGPWEEELKEGNVYNKFQPGSTLLITNYPDCGGSEMRSWCHETVAGDWQKFRSSENYNKLAYHTEFPWMADGAAGEISMNYGVKNQADQWEVLRLYTFRSFEHGVYRRDAVLETNPDIRFQLADIPLPNGVLRVDKVITPLATDIRLGHYSLPHINGTACHVFRQVIDDMEATIVTNDSYQLAMIPLRGWSDCEVVSPVGLHPEAEQCTVAITTDQMAVGEKLYISLQLWKRGTEPFTTEELSPVELIQVIDGGRKVELSFRNGEKKIVYF